MKNSRKLGIALLVAAFALLTAAFAAAQEHAAAPGHAPVPAMAPPHTGEQGAHDPPGEPSGEHSAEAHGGGHHGLEPLNIGDIFDKRRPALIALFLNFGVLMTRARSSSAASPSARKSTRRRRSSPRPRSGRRSTRAI